VPEKEGVDGPPFSCFSNRADMSSRTGLEAEAINRLTDGVQPPEIRAILVQCLAGEVAPSTAIARMIATSGAPTVRAAIDDVTHRAATISRASDMLVHDRVDELTQVFVEHVAELADVSEASKSRPGAEAKRRLDSQDGLRSS
jgi:hypothetical protein